MLMVPRPLNIISITLRVIHLCRPAELERSVKAQARYSKQERYKHLCALHIVFVDRTKEANTLNLIFLRSCY